MKSPFSALLILFSVTLLLSACEVETETEVKVGGAANTPSAADLITEVRDVSEFKRVRLETVGELNLMQGDSEQVRLELSPKYEDAIQVEILGDTLVISAKRNTITQINRDVLRYNVTLPQLEAVELAGSGDVTLNSFNAEGLALSLDGSGDISAEGLEVGRLELDLSGSGDVRLAGSADALMVGLEGSGDVDARGLRAQQVEIGLAGSGDVDVCALGSLALNVAGSGDVTYYGEPSLPELNLTGSGEADAGGACP